MWPIKGAASNLTNLSLLTNGCSIRMAKRNTVHINKSIGHKVNEIKEQ